jgi:hypothetical protein
MRRLLASLAVTLAAAPAFAEPSHEACFVAVMRAPDDVRVAIDERVRAEPRCTNMLEVRVVPTDGGLYLFARAFPDGRVHERIVPDALSASVLVASWAAEPWPVVVSHRSVAAVEGAPGESPVVAPAEDATRWLTLGGTAMDRRAGVRGELDLWSRGRWTLGVLAAVTVHEVGLNSDPDYYGLLRTVDIEAMGVLGYTMRSGRWRMRPAVSLGFVDSHVEALEENFSNAHTGPWRQLHADGAFAAIGASLMISRELGSRWAIAGGPVVTYVSEHFGDEMSVLIRREAIVTVFAGVQRRL